MQARPRLLAVRARPDGAVPSIEAAFLLPIAAACCPVEVLGAPLAWVLSQCVLEAPPLIAVLCSDSRLRGLLVSFAKAARRLLSISIDTARLRTSCSSPEKADPEVSGVGIIKASRLSRGRAIIGLFRPFRVYACVGWLGRL